MESVIKIVAIGPESTGKSTLCQKLAAHYDTTWIPEYARTYLEKNGAAYKYEDLMTIARGQLGLEDSIRIPVDYQLPDSQNNGLVFIDTDLHVMKVWSEFVFNSCDNWILNRIAERKYDLYLLCNIDLPWVEDPLREYPDRKVREKLYNYYEELVTSQSTPWCVISGNYEERLEKAISCVDQFVTRKTVRK